MSHPVYWSIDSNNNSTTTTTTNNNRRCRRRYHHHELSDSGRSFRCEIN